MKSLFIIIDFLLVTYNFLIINSNPVRQQVRTNRSHKPDSKNVNTSKTSHIYNCTQCTHYRLKC